MATHSSANAMLEAARKLQAQIEVAHHSCESIEVDVQDLAAEKHAIHAELERMQRRCENIDVKFEEKQREYHHIKRQMEQYESQYMRLLESSPTLVHVMKGKKLHM